MVCCMSILVYIGVDRFSGGYDVFRGICGCSGFVRIAGRFVVANNSGV